MKRYKVLKNDLTSPFKGMKYEKVGYDLEKALFPFGPLSGSPKKITQKEIELLKHWDSVWDSVGGSVRDSVGDSVWDSVWDSVGGSIFGS